MIAVVIAYFVAGPHPRDLPALASLVPLITRDYPLSEHFDHCVASAFR
jgi:hypothetical protein